MQDYQTICICGGGSLGHTISANISQNGDFQVNLLTGHPLAWSNQIDITDCNGEIIKGHIKKISSNPQEVIPDADIVLLCIPGYLIPQTLTTIAPYIKKDTEIGSVVCSNGFFWMANHILGQEKHFFGFQRVPFISRVKEYGKSAELKGYKSILKIGGNKNSDLDRLSTFFTQSLKTKTISLNHYLEATLTNSNPLLHPARIYSMFSQLSTDVYDKEFLFYEEWDNYSSEVLLQSDQEFQQIISCLSIHQKEIPSLLTYYESTDASSLTKKIRSIQAFKGIKMAMKPYQEKYKVDYTNRYFTEDIPYGLLIIKSFGLLLSIDTPQIDQIILWIQKRMGKEYLVNGTLRGKDIQDSGIIQNFGIKTIEDLYQL